MAVESSFNCIICHKDKLEVPVEVGVDLSYLGHRTLEICNACFEKNFKKPLGVSMSIGLTPNEPLVDTNWVKEIAKLGVPNKNNDIIKHDALKKLDMKDRYMGFAEWSHKLSRLEQLAAEYGRSTQVVIETMRRLLFDYIGDTFGYARMTIEHDIATIEYVRYINNDHRIHEDLDSHFPSWHKYIVLQENPKE